MFSSCVLFVCILYTVNGGVVAAELLWLFKRCRPSGSVSSAIVWAVPIRAELQHGSILCQCSRGVYCVPWGDSVRCNSVCRLHRDMDSEVSSTLTGMASSVLSNGAPTEPTKPSGKSEHRHSQFWNILDPCKCEHVRAFIREGNRYNEASCL